MREGKTTPFEGGQKVPTIIAWPGKVKAKQLNHEFANMMDWFPTFIELTDSQYPTDTVIDGQSLAPVLFNKGKRKPTPFFYFHLRIPYLSSQQAEIAGVRDNQWKLLLKHKGLYPKFLEPFIKAGRYSFNTLLFDLSEDPNEQYNLARKHPEQVARLQQLIAEFENSTTAGRATRGRAADNDTKGHSALYIGLAIAVIVLLIPVGILFWGILRCWKILHSK